MSERNRPRRGRIVGLAGLMLGVVAANVTAQERPDPRLMFSVYGGVVTSGRLWSIPRQPLAVLFGPTAFDTLRLSRALTAAPTVGLSATLFGSSDWGVTGDIAYLGLRVDDDCTMVYETPDAQSRNATVCDDITRRLRTASVVTFSVGGARRFAARSLVTPYVRIQAGLSVRSSSLVKMSGRVLTVVTDSLGTRQVVSERVVVGDDKQISLGPEFAAGAGVMWGIAPGYQLRLELRDHVIFLDRPTGPADPRDPLALVEKQTIIKNMPALVIGVDIVLEKRRGRRY